MMRLFCGLVLTLFVLVFAGCDVQTGIAPVEVAIKKCSNRDFGFVGTWLPLSNEELAEDVTSFQMVIEREDEYTVVLDGLSEEDDKLKANFRTHEISPDHPHAIVEIEFTLVEGISHRRLVIAAVKDDHLYLWTIDGRKVGEQLYQDGVAAVIEHSMFSTSVRCDSQKLIDSLSKYSSKITGTVQVFKRKIDD